MKKALCLFLGLMLVSLACQALLPSRSTPRPQPTTALSGREVTKGVFASTAEITESVTSTPFPVPSPIQCTDDSCLDACLKRIANTIPQKNYEPLSGPYAENEINLNLVHYDVKDGQLGEPQFLYVPDAFKAMQSDTTAQHNVWAYASSLLPAEQLRWISNFEIFSSTYYAAWVNPAGPNQEDRADWVLGIEISQAQNLIDLTYVLTHEYGHLISLNTSQISTTDYYYDWHQNSAVCAQFLSPDGCSTPHSYINRFYQKFWKNIFDEWLKDVETPNVNSPDEFRALVHDFYQKHDEQFTREYAATNIDEDLAESFMHFVLDPKPTGNNVVGQKIRFFYDFPELVTLRQFMIQRICSYTGQ